MRLIIAIPPLRLPRLPWPGKGRKARSGSAGLGRLVRPHRAALAGVAGFAVLAGGFGATAGYFVRLDMPSLTGLADYQPPEMTRIRARDGSEIANFASEKRLSLGYGQIPQSFRDALIASEDSRFAEHAGIDVFGIGRALLRDLQQMEMTEGASTLTMQLAGNLYLDRSQRTVRRKLQEAFLAMEIERRYSKQEILRFYTNQVHFGHGLYGLEAAAQHFFGKTAPRLSLGESATLVGLLPRPAGYSPLVNLGRATERRNLVLRRMVDEGYLTAADFERERELPLLVADQDDQDTMAPHFTEEVRRHLQESYGTGELYRGGLVVETTLDPELQRSAERAVDFGLRALDKRQGWRREAIRRIPAELTPETWDSPAWNAGIRTGDVTDGIVVSVTPDQAVVRVGSRRGLLTRESIAWTGRTRVDRLVEAGDVIHVGIERSETDRVELTLEQRPTVEAALVAIDPRTGEVLAMVGGADFSRSEFNRVTQARRQPGSLFKPFIYAAAFEKGWTLADRMLDEPTVFLEGRRAIPYQPENFSRNYYETITLRTALEKSANIATVKLLREVGYDSVIETTRQLGVTSRLRPYPSLALGVFEVSLLEVTSAYGTFVNEGLRMEPHWVREIRDRTGATLFASEPKVQSALSREVAHLVTAALEGVIERGTGKTAKSALGRTLAGKTGTTDNYTDAWFVGYSSDLVVGVWVGFDDPKSLGTVETGGRAALPIWIEFMRDALEPRPDRRFRSPAGTTRVRIDPFTGLRPAAESDCVGTIVETFRDGTEPTAFCSKEQHRLLRMPYPFQRYSIDSRGSLAIPGNELIALLDSEPRVEVSRDGRLRHTDVDGNVTELRLAVLPDRDAETVVPDDPELDPSSWRGTDGRMAQIVWFGRPGG